MNHYIKVIVYFLKYWWYTTLTAKNSKQ